MTIEDLKKDPEAQRNLFIFLVVIVLLILWLLLGGLARTTVRAMAGLHRSPVPAAASPPAVAAVSAPVVPPAVVRAAPLNSASTALETPGALVGHFSGGAAIAKQGFCSLSLEIRQAPEGKFLGYPELSCVANPLLTGQPLDPKTNPAILLGRTNPTAAILSGTVVNGSVQFRVDKVTNSNAAGCNMTSFTATPFGSKQLAVEWGDSCGSTNNMMLQKLRQ